MKVIILAAGQGTRLRPLTDHCPKCMVEVNGKSIIERQLDTMHSCGIEDKDITIIAGYRNDVLKEKFKDTEINFIVNEEYENTNMVCSLMCARSLMEAEDDILISYGDIIYNKEVLGKILQSETLMSDDNDYLTEIGQKTSDLNKVQSQYIGLMRFKGEGLKAVLDLSAEAKRRSEVGEALWRTERTYAKMYMTDLLQGLIDEKHKLKAVHIQRGWFEIDDCDDLKVVESQLK